MYVHMYVYMYVHIYTYKLNWQHFQINNKLRILAKKKVLTSAPEDRLQNPLYLDNIHSSRL